MGPHFFKCGKAAPSTFSAPLLGAASMGPHFFKCGKVGCARLVVGILSASMGPHFFKCGKQRNQKRLITKKICFNGAALFQVRKDGHA